MRHLLRALALFSVCITCTALAGAQQSSSDSKPGSLALQAVGANQKAQAPDGASPSQPPTQSGIAERARQLRGQDLAKVRVSPEDAEKILNSVQLILKFASSDSGLPIHGAVQPRMISRDDMRARMEERKVSDEDAKRLQASELTLKKFGYVPRTFSTGKFVQGMYAELTAGFYNAKEKTISLLNWVAPEEQKSVLAHELTHALQDQNFNLIAWQTSVTQAAPGPEQFEVGQQEALQESDARRAVVEGQAMIPLIDYQLMESGSEARLAMIPGAANAISQYMSLVPIPDTPVIHDSPIMLRDGLAFPYREGLVFELVLLGAGGRELAFRRVFAHPPLNTHEILQPAAYLQRQKIQAPQIPDLKAVLADKYEVLDAGGLGELDVRSLIKQLADSHRAERISNGWRGSSYLVVKRKLVPTEAATTADVGLIYVSTWSSSIVTHQFARFYADAVAKRYSQATPMGEATTDRYQFNTEEGLVSIECRPNNMVLVTESLEPDTAVAVNSEILKANATPTHRAANAPPELSSRYLSSPVFTGLREMWEQRMLLEVLKTQGIARDREIR